MSFKHISFLVLLLAGFFLISCSQESSQESVIPSDDTSWYEQEELDLDVLNNHIRESKIKDLSQVIDLLAPEEEFAEGNYKYSIHRQDVSDSEVIITVTETGLADDSIAGQKTKIKLKKEGDYWVVQDVLTSFQCQANRGHTTWGKEFCQ
ncbi:hypothetical protein GKC56_07710 [Neisseriaceae bacterium PsAf]|nr:hypothetical protein [Neisseriaceae bacterium PsAf]MCV2502698.1 hypothetical protein [Neisseriaceae bacterium]